jgi:uncharacterized protein
VTAARPPIAPELAPFWAAAARGELLLPQCERCGLHIWYPRPYCPDCASLDIRWVRASGFGHVYSFTIDRRHARDAAAPAEPRVLAYVALEEGPRVVSNIVGADPDSIRIGQRVKAVFEPIDENVGLLRFRAVELSPSISATTAFR